MVGVIGSGKSSVMDALCYGLFGTFPALQNRRVSTTDLLMRKPVAADQAKVSVSFAIEDKKYRVERILKRNGTNEGRLYLGENLLVGPKPSQVTERVEKELQVTYELFARSVYSEQNNVDYFLKLNPSDRKKKFDELLDLQKYETVRSNANQVAGHFRKSQESVKQTLQQFDQVLQNQDLNELRVKMEMQKKKTIELQGKLTNHTQNGDSLKGLRNELAKKNKVQEETKGKIQSFRSQTELMQKRMHLFQMENPTWTNWDVAVIQTEKFAVENSIKALVSKQEQHRQLDLQVQKAKQRAELNEKRHRDWQSVLKGEAPETIRTKITEMEAQRSDLKKKSEHAQNELTTCQSILHMAEEQLKLVATESASMLALHATCPTCRQEISSAHKEALVQVLSEKKAEWTSKKTEAESQKLALLKEKNGAETVLKGLEAAVRELDVMHARVEEGKGIEKEIESAKKDHENAVKAMNVLGTPVLNSDIETARTHALLLDKAMEMARVKGEMNTIHSLLQKEETALKELGDVREELDAANASYSRYESELNAMRREMELVSQVEKELLARLESAERILAQREDLALKLQVHKDVEETLSVFSNSLIITQQQLREGVIEAINAALQELWPALYPYGDFDLAKVQIQDNDYVLSVREKSGGWIEAESSLSGGERSAAALALRMAIAFVLTRQLSWIILDEPTHNLDVKSVHTLSTMLRERLPGLVDQVFVITHSPEIEKAATGSLYVLQRDKNNDGVTMPQSVDLDLGTKIN